MVGRKDSSFEREREGVECGLPSVHPSRGALAGGVEAAHDKVEAFHGGLLVREVSPRSRRAPEPRVQALDRVGRVDHASDLGAVVQERHELAPRVLPQRLDRRVAVTPARAELDEAFLRRLLVDRGVDGSQLAGHRVPVLTGREPERVADQVQHTGLHDRQRPRRADRLGESLEPVTDDDAHIGDATVLDLGEDPEPELRALSTGRGPDPEDVSLAFDGDADRGVERPVGDLTVTDLDWIASMNTTG